MIRFIFYISIVVVVFITSFALSEAGTSYKLSVPFPGEPTSFGGQGAPVGITQYIKTIYRAAWGIGTLLAMVMVVIGAVEYTLSEAVTRKEDAKDRISSALWGLLLLLTAALIFNTINPRIPALTSPTLSNVPGAPPTNAPSVPNAPSFLLANVATNPLRIVLNWTNNSPPPPVNVINLNWSGNTAGAGGNNVVALPTTATTYTLNGVQPGVTYWFTVRVCANTCSNYSNSASVTVPGTAPPPGPYCGNGVVDPGEDCEPPGSICGGSFPSFMTCNNSCDCI